MPLQVSEIVERIGAAEFGRVDDAHQHVTNACTVFGQVKQTVFAVKDRLLQSSFAKIIVQGRPGLSQKQREPMP